jgi:nitroreductase
MALDRNSFNDLIRHRRSVFQSQFTGETVDDEIVKQMLINGTWAPTHKMTEPWRFIVFTGDGIQQLAQEQAHLYKEVTTKDGTFKEDRYQNLLTKPKLSSHIIVVIMKRDEKKSVPEVEEIGAVFCAVQNILLTAAAYQVGCYLSTGGITYFKEANTLFDLSEEDKVLGFLHIGKPKPSLPDSRRKPVDEKSAWVK